MNPLFYRLAKNALFSGSATIISLLAGLFMTPYLVLRLGTELFGAWALLSVLTGLVSLFDLSLKSSFVTYTTEAYAQHDHPSAAAILSTGIVFYSGLVALSGFVLWRYLYPILGWLNIRPGLFPEVGMAYLFGLGGFLLTLTFSVIPAAWQARQRIDIPNILGVLSLVLGILLTILAVESGFGLTGVAAAQFVSIAVYHLACYLGLRFLFGPLGLSLSKVKGSWLKRLFSYSLKLHISAICDIVNRQLDKLLISRWTELSFVTSYELGLRIAANAGVLQPSLAVGLLPASSHLRALGQESQLASLYAESARYLFLVGFPLYLFMGIHAHTLMLAWLGHPDPKGAVFLILLTAGYMVNSLSNGMAFVCQGMGRPDIQMKQSAVQLILNVLLSVSLIISCGPFGAPAGTSLALVIGAFYFALNFHRALNLPLWFFIRKTAGPPFLASLLAACCSWFAIVGLSGSSRAEALAKLFWGFLVFLPVYLILCWCFGFIRTEDLMRLRSFGREFVQRIRGT
jgi:O-antigen/teichoic acid export membrane protein